MRRKQNMNNYIGGREETKGLTGEYMEQLMNHIFGMHSGKLKYSGHLKRKCEIRNTETMEAFKEGVPEIVLPYTVRIGARYWSDGVLGIYAEVSELGTMQMLEEEFTAETPAHIDSFVDDLVNSSAYLSLTRVHEKLAGEFGEKLRHATRSGIEELIVG